MTTVLANQIANVEADCAELRMKVEQQQNTIERQRGAIEEGRAYTTELRKQIEQERTDMAAERAKEREQHLKIIQRQGTLIGRYQDFISKLGHGFRDLDQAKRATAETLPQPEKIEAPVDENWLKVSQFTGPIVTSIKDRMARMNGGEAA
jgi:chromosome segregation ATPase